MHITINMHITMILTFSKSRRKWDLPHARVVVGADVALIYVHHNQLYS